MDPRQQALALIKGHRAYRLAPFRHILEEFLEHAGSPGGLRGMRVLELGPGRRADLLRFLAEQGGASRVLGMGRAVLHPWTRDREFIREHVEEAFLPERLRETADASFDLIYSRRFMERHSIDPWVLLFSRRYWSRFRGEGFRHLGEEFPSSTENIRAVFREAFRVLAPGGVIISEIAKRKYSALERGFLESLGPRRVKERRLGRHSSMVTVVK